ncbi:MAG: hypothetical protein RIS60_694, partial [Pseudomonadota bacterium]
MQNEPMVRIDQVLWGNALEQFQFNGQGRLAGRQTRAVAHSKNVRVNRHG